MNVLIITKYAWDDRIASGNTLSNLFYGLKDFNQYCIYCRDSLPNNQCCSEYFSVSPIKLVKNIFCPWKNGNYISIKPGTSQYKEDGLENSLKVISKNHQFFFDLITDILYTLRLWLNSRFKKFLSQANPDLIFSFGVPDSYNYQMLKYIKKNIKCPIVSYFVDDRFSNNDTRWNLLQRIWDRRLKRIVKITDKCYAISQMMCEEYSKKTGKEFYLLYKGCDKSIVRQYVNSPIRLTYAGNLLYGRDQTLEALTLSLVKLQKEGIDVHLDIYTNTHIDSQKESLLNCEGVCTLHSVKPYEEIKKIMHESDIVLHVESFEEKQQQKVRLSFSTKITDCLQSGAMVLAIGPNDVASIDYLTRIPGVVVIKKLADIDPTIVNLFKNKSECIQKALLTSVYVNENLSLIQVRERIHNDFMNLVNSYKS